MKIAFIGAGRVASTLAIGFARAGLEVVLEVACRGSDEDVGREQAGKAGDLDLVHISVGDIFRWNVQNHTKMGAQVREGPRSECLGPGSVSDGP